MKQTPTSPYAPDLEELRSWLEQRVAQLKLVELVATVIALIARMSVPSRGNLIPKIHHDHLAASSSTHFPRRL